MANRLNKMKCFVATALGHADVDRVYNKAIRPVLRDLGVKPLRIDRIEHNDDIDNQIFALLNASHFCIADLTYARPSAYYEAGYALGSNRPVIYIVRNDHFRNPEDDKRVHFDLQMKNIIGWTKANDAFKHRLRKRVRHILAPLIKQRNVDLAAKAAERAFDGLPANQQVLQLMLAGRRVLEGLGYRPIKEREEDRPPGTGEVASLPYFRTRAGVRWQVHLVVGKQVPVKLFQPHARWGEDVGPYMLTPPVPDKAYKSLKGIRSFLLLAGLRGPKEQALRAGLASWRPLGDKVFGRREWSTGKRDAPHDVHLAVLDNPKSIPAYSERLADLLGRWARSRVPS